MYMGFVWGDVMGPFFRTILALLTCSGLWTAAVELIKYFISRRSGIKKDIAELSKEIAVIHNQIQEEDERRLQDKAEIARARIVRFNDELLNGIHHSRSMFDMILIDCSKYNNYCDSHPGFRNGVAVEAINHIRSCYRKCEQDKDFL